MISGCGNRSSHCFRTGFQIMNSRQIANRPTSSPNGLLTVAELAIRLRVKSSWVYAHADELGAYRVGKYLRFDWNVVVARLAAGAARLSPLGVQPNDRF